MVKLLTFIFLIGPVSLFANERLIEKDFRKKVYKQPLREFSVIVTDDGFYPNKMMAFVGEKVRFFLTTTSKKSQCFVLQKHEIFISAEKGRLNEAEVVLENPGRYKFYCPASKHEGFLTVTEKFAAQEEPARTVASEEVSDKPKYWTPRDYDE